MNDEDKALTSSIYMSAALMLDRMFSMSACAMSGEDFKLMSKQVCLYFLKGIMTVQRF